MVIVSKISNNYVNNPNILGKNFAAENAQNSTKENNKIKKESTPAKEDSLVKNTFSNRIKVGWDKTTSIPFVHFPRGLGGAPDYTFFEFLQTAKFPFYIGGPILAALFYAGVKNDNLKSAKAAKTVAKHMALGVGLYYLGAALAKTIINKTVKASRGIDLDQPYRKYISTSTNQTGVFKKDVEYHKVYESADFTRWDLLYKKGKNPQEINETYNKIARRYGIKAETNDADSSTIPLIKKTILMARAWQYALTAFFVTMGIGMANQDAWKHESSMGFKKTISKGIFGKNMPMKNRLENAKTAVGSYIVKPFFKSIAQFWKGHSTASSIAGKSVIISTALATTLAISLLLSKTSARGQKIETTVKDKNDEVKQ